MSLPVAGGKRKRFSFAEKYEILQELDKGAKRTFVQEKYGVAHGTLAGFIKKREKIDYFLPAMKPANKSSVTMLKIQYGSFWCAYWV